MWSTQPLICCAVISVLCVLVLFTLVCVCASNTSEGSRLLTAGSRRAMFSMETGQKRATSPSGNVTQYSSAPHGVSSLLCATICPLNALHTSFQENVILTKTRDSNSTRKEVCFVRFLVYIMETSNLNLGAGYPEFYHGLRQYRNAHSRGKIPATLVE